MAEEINSLDDEFIRLLRRMLKDYLAGKLGGASGDRPQPYLTEPSKLYVHNGSGETIPAWACMQVTGTEELGGQNYLVVDKPTDVIGTTGEFVFNGPESIADGEDGLAQNGPVLRGYKNTGTITAGERWSPTSGQWYLSQDDSGVFTACGADDIDGDVLKVVRSPLVGFHAVAPSGGIPAKSGSTMGSATCTLQDCSSSGVLSNAGAATIYNPSTTAIAGSAAIIYMVNSAGLRVAIVESCS